MRFTVLGRHVDYHANTIRIVGCDLATAYREAKSLIRAPSFLALDRTDRDSQEHCFSILTPNVKVDR